MSTQHCLFASGKDVREKVFVFKVGLILPSIVKLSNSPTRKLIQFLYSYTVNS